MIDTDDGFAGRLASHATANPSGLFARFRGDPVTYGDLERRSNALAGWLKRDGIAKGDRIALMIHNSPTALALLFAIAKTGAVWVPINVQARGDNLAYVLSHSAPDRLIAEHDLLPIIGESGAGLAADRIWTLGAPEAVRAVEPLLENPTAFHGPLPAADDLFAIMYTSGTTGKPKGVMVSHRMLRLSGESIALVSGAEADGGAGPGGGAGAGNVFHMWEPLFHIGGAQMIVLPLIRPLHLAMVDRFSASAFWNQVREYNVSHIHFLGGILQILLKQPPQALDKSHGARVAFGGGCPPDVWRAFEQRFGVEIRECYGMTEASSVTTFNTRNVVGSVGRAVPWLDVDVLDGKGNPVAAGTRGEIVVRENLPGALTTGYFRNPEATAKTLRDGSLHTGDIGSFDADGNMYFHGRDSDNVRVRGQNVTAWEVEHVVARHPSVEDCAMIGVAAEVGEQDIKLFVKLKNGSDLGPAELSGWLATRLAGYQNPRYIAILDAFERTPSQRIMKHRLSAATGDAWDRTKGLGE
jgi:crotonobetaine/carnitine-CoA ligase